MKKLAILLIAAALMGGCLTACGGDGGGQTNDNPAVSSTASTQSKAEEKINIVKENFKSGVLLDDGKNYFAIDSMEMTDEGLVITYRAECDPAVQTNQRGSFEAHCRRFELNGSYPDKIISRTQKGAEYERKQTGNSLLAGLKDTPYEILIPNSALKELEITQVPTLSVDMELGYYENGWGLRKSAEFSFTVSP